MLDVVIIGAGAAGIAAADHLRKAGASSLILEARARIGGRVQTDTSFANFPIERGAEFIHGEHAATWSYIREFGLDTIPVPRHTLARWGTPAVPIEALETSERAIYHALHAAYADLIHQAHDFNRRDQSLESYFAARGFDNAAMQMADTLFAQTCCARLDQLSCADLAREIIADHAGTQEFRLTLGYSALFDQIAARLNIQLGQRVIHIIHHADHVEVQTEQTIFSARRCILTLPIAVLQTNHLTFDPPLSERKRAAIHALKMHPATKLIYRLRQPVWTHTWVYGANRDSSIRWWTPGYARTNADAVMIGYVTADGARAADQATTDDYVPVLKRVLGYDIASLIAVSERVSWASDEYAGGGYASVPPGEAWARVVLAQAEGALCFAGEATAHETNPQTVHGAIESGWRAAREVVVSLQT